MARNEEALIFVYPKVLVNSNNMRLYLYILYSKKRYATVA